MQFHTHQILAICGPKRKKAALQVEKCGRGGEKKNLGRQMREKFSAVSKRFFKSRQIFLGENKT